MAVTGYTKRFPRQGSAANEIAMRDKEWKVFDSGIDQQAKARLEASFESYCEYGPENLPDSLFKFVGQHQHGGVKVRIEEFKAWGVRMFGLRGDDGGQPTFLVTGSDTAKKSTESRKANRIAMEVAAKEAAKVQTALDAQKQSKRGKRK